MTSPLNLPAPGRRQWVYGALRGLAPTCVFAKQSLEPIHCGWAPLREQVPSRTPSTPSSEVTGSVCRVPWPRFTRSPEATRLAHLCRFTVRTTPGLPDGLFLRVDSKRLGLGRSPPLAFHSRPPYGKAYGVRRPSTKPLPLCSTVPPQFIAKESGPEYSPASHRLRLWGLDLGPASPCADRHGAGTLGLTVVEVFTPLCAYSFRHPHFAALHQGFHPGFHARRTLPYPSYKV